VLVTFNYLVSHEWTEARDRGPFIRRDMAPGSHWNWMRAHLTPSILFTPAPSLPLVIEYGRRRIIYA
jgi:hypothetical protein